ncbi:MAG: gentisate 1,2-dioxygenase [Salinisphaeraceae bacterium]|nr:gentisate 1,2-dioxygenase [Salinisphaeraceae bacterium]
MASTNPTPSTDNAAEREAFYDAIDPEHMRALWSVLDDLVTPQPASRCQPWLWRFDAVRTRLEQAGKLISAEEAVRRVLILENPGLRGRASITTSLYAGIQSVLPGEVAPSHRHTQSALRFVLDAAPGAFTRVDGEKTEMHTGDFVITPNWHFHDHGNDGDQPVYWLDGLDIPLVQFLDASFAEKGSETQQRDARPAGDSLARYGANMLPVDYRPGSGASPIFNYPYARSREALEIMRRRDEWDPCHGLKMRYVNPADGGWAIPTIGTTLQLLPAGFVTETYRSTDATVFVPVEGRGRSRIGEQWFEWGPRDLFVCPSWAPIVHEPAEDAVLFAYSDRPVQEALSLWRESRGVPDRG